MHVTSNMIDRQLRARGTLLKLLMGSSSEARFRWTQKLLRKAIVGRNIKGLRCRTEWIERPDGTKLRMRVYQPKEPAENVPGLLWLHGGGYATGVPEMCFGSIRRMVEASGCTVVAPDYLLSIEAPYPAAIEDCYTALLWMKEHTADLGIRSDQLMVGGESAGGGLTAALTLLARDRGEVNIAFQMPLYPMLDDRMVTESARENDAPVWNSDYNRLAWRMYLGPLFGGQVPAHAAAARANDYHALPPTATFVGDLEPFRDETVRYIADLKAAGVPVHFAVYPGCYHAFDLVAPGAEVSKQAVAALMESFSYAVKHYFSPQPADSNL